ncbi:PilX N-terminal domain-containing pilus assembly protein [Aliiglaciecola sp. CAU 1673]|uniref:PilX N-terminal domain-containing pilus assembly protein n=1 Tax=Aliiglaciecola sp. CAU 1673 TaxID=3032595 RepID=UPI0023DBDD21|nr:PilX N-terminal domain-containing pilus assembly protein [Aliiglaciecola sp. CAU 1673]MDF2178224.1 PilX N-terminal domain-containing pilus assembly protein [Aliiglaciecola sp. CAU 1673]
MKQQGLVLVLALLVLMSLTILGVTAVSSSLMQNKMAGSMERQLLAFDAAEAAIAGVMFESEDTVVLQDDNLVDPLSQARQGAAIDLANQDLSCFDQVNWTDRAITNAGLQAGTEHRAVGNYNDAPKTQSWSKTAFVGEQACLGSSNVIGGSNISCHVFLVRGCGQIDGQSFAIANTLKAAVFAPAQGNQL